MFVRNSGTHGTIAKLFDLGAYRSESRLEILESAPLARVLLFTVTCPPSLSPLSRRGLEIFASLGSRITYFSRRK